MNLHWSKAFRPTEVINLPADAAATNFFDFYESTSVFKMLLPSIANATGGENLTK